MADSTNLRISTKVAERLKPQATAKGLSLNALAEEVLDREATFGPDFTNRPVNVPPGLSALAHDLEEAGKPGAKQQHWFLVYHDTVRNVVFCMAGGIEAGDVHRLHLLIRPFGSQIKYAIPRQELIAWQPLERINESGIAELTYPWQNQGAFLHRAVNIGEQYRLVNKIFTHPY